MGDNGRYERIVERLRRSRERRDGSQLLDGLRAFRLDTWYGGGVIARAASDAGIARSLLYEYRLVWAFYWQTHQGEQYSAWRIIRLFPHLTYTHLRDAIELEDLDVALAAFEAAAVGDGRFPEFDKLLPMTTEAFRVYVAKLLDKPVPPFVEQALQQPIFHYEGQGQHVLAELHKDFDKWRARQVRVEVFKVR